MSETLISNLEIIKLNNGLTLYLNQRPNSNLVSSRLFINAGSADVDVSQAGLPHFVEHVVCDFHNSRVKRLFDNINSTGGYVNAATYRYGTTIIGDLRKEHISQWFELLNLTLDNLNVDSKKVERERNVILSEISSREDSDTWQYIEVQALGDYAFTNNAVGTEEIINAIENSDIEEFIKKHYFKENMALIFVGNFDKQFVIEKATDSFGKIPQNGEYTRSSNYHPPPLKNLKVPDIDDKNVVFLGVRILCPLKDSYAYSVLRVIQQYLQNRLFAFVRDRGLAYSINVHVRRHNPVSMFSIYSFDAKKDKKTLYAKIDEELDLIKNNRIDPAEFELAKQNVISDKICSLDYEGDLADFYLATLNVAGIETHVRDVTLDYRKVTEEDFVDIANRFFIDENRFKVKAKSQLHWQTVVAWVPIIVWYYLTLYVVFSLFPLELPKHATPVTVFLFAAVLWLLYDKFKR